MRKLITDLALEGKTDGAPNGHFYLTKDAVQTSARDVVEQHFGWNGKKRDDYVQQ